MKSSTLVFIFIGSVAAQSGTSSAPLPTSTSNIPQCILNCLAKAATSAGCDSYTNISCVCGNSEFKQLATDCLSTQCSTEEQQAAAQMQQQVCGASTGSSGSSTATAPASSSSASVTSHGSASSASHISSLTASASAVLSSLSSAAASVTGSSNSAVQLATFDFAAAGLWGAIAVGGAVVAQLVV